jgi:hypothetical protein
MNHKYIVAHRQNDLCSILETRGIEVRIGGSQGYPVSGASAPLLLANTMNTIALLDQSFLQRNKVSVQP